MCLKICLCSVKFARVLCDCGCLEIQSDKLLRPLGREYHGGYASVRCPLISVLHDTILPHLVERFQRILAQIFIMSMSIDEMFLKVRGQ